MFARYSRYQGTLRRLYLDEFAGDERRPPGLRRRGGRARPQALRAHLPRLRRRLGSPAGRRPRGLRVGLERDDQAAPARPAGRLPRAVHALHPLRLADRGGARLPLLAPSVARARVRGGDGLPLRLLLRVAAAGGGLGRRALPPPRRRARGRASPCAAGEGARPAARAAAGRLALARGDVRQRPGLRAAAAAPVRLAAARGARLRRHDPVRDQGGDAELRGARRAAGARRRVDLLPDRPLRRRRPLGAPAGARPQPRATSRSAPRCACCRSTATRTGCWRRCCSRRRAPPRRRRAAPCGRFRPTSARRCWPSWSASGATAATGPGAASRRCATASRWCPTTARSATCSATACSPSSGRRSGPTWAPACPRSSRTRAWRTSTARASSARAPSTRRIAEAGHPELAPYALCLGYRIRYVLDMNAREAMHMIELRSGREGHPGLPGRRPRAARRDRPGAPRRRRGDDVRGPRHGAAPGADPVRDPGARQAGFADLTYLVQAPRASVRRRDPPAHAGGARGALDPVRRLRSPGRAGRGGDGRRRARDPRGRDGRPLRPADHDRAADRRGPARPGARPRRRARRAPDGRAPRAAGWRSSRPPGPTT